LHFLSIKYLFEAIHPFTRWFTGEYDYIIIILKFYDNKVWANGYKTFKYEFRIHTKKLSNENTCFYMTQCFDFDHFSSTSTEMLFGSFIIV